jgi:hypothetical protein
MTINVNPNESPNEGRDNSDEVNSSEVPVYQLMDGFDEDIDQNDNTSDDSVEDNYELLSQDLNESNDQMTYYEHNVVVDWIDVQNETNSNSNSDTNEDINSIDTKTNESIANDSNEEMFVTNNDLVERRLSLSDGKYFASVFISFYLKLKLFLLNNRSNQ